MSLAPFTLRYEYPHELVPPGKTASVYLRELTLEGLARRYPQGTTASVSAQIEHELQLLSELETIVFQRESRNSTNC